jgi:NADH:ubiquinone oxidoreductase subunit 3 (subunit A)
MKQTAVEWLEERLTLSFGDELKSVRGFFVIAKEMEKEQIMDAYECGFDSEHDARLPQSSMRYYKETFNTNDK